MPCSSSQGVESGQGWHRANERELQARNDHITAVACEALKLLQQKGLILDLPRDVQDWWRDHQAWDVKRKAQEAEQKRVQATQLRETIAEAERKLEELERS